MLIATFIKSFYQLRFISLDQVDESCGSESDKESGKDDSETETCISIEKRKHKGKLLTHMRKVNSIESSLDEKNYNSLILPEEQRKITGEISDTNNQKNKKTITFSNQTCVTTGRQKAEGCIQNTPGVSPYGRNANSPAKTFSVFMTDDLLQHIFSCTNKKMEMLPRQKNTLRTHMPN